MSFFIYVILDGVVKNPISFVAGFSQNLNIPAGIEDATHLREWTAWWRSDIIVETDRGECG